VTSATEVSCCGAAAGEQALIAKDSDITADSFRMVVNDASLEELDKH
jgi:hypothetical protein